MRFYACVIQLGGFVAKNISRKQHTGGRASNTACTDLTVFDVHEILHREVFFAQGKARRLVAEKAAHDVFF